MKLNDDSVTNRYGFYINFNQSYIKRNFNADIALVALFKIIFFFYFYLFIFFDVKKDGQHSKVMTIARSFKRSGDLCSKEILLGRI